MTNQDLHQRREHRGMRRLRGRRHATAALAIAGILVALTTPGRADDDDAPDLDSRPHITVVGTATGTLAPDRASLRVGIEARRPSAGEAWQSVATIAEAVVTEAKAHGVKSEDLQTARYSLSERFKSVRRPDGSFEQVTDGYEANTNLEVRTGDLGGVGSLAQALIEKGATSLNGIDFFNSHAQATADDLRGSAVRDARRQAEIIAKAGGVHLGQLLQVEPARESGMARPPVIRAERAAVVPVQPGLESLTESVEATFAIE